MILAKIQFGRGSEKEKDDLENLAHSYLAALLHAGQICGEYFLTWIGGRLYAHVLLTCPQAMRARFHSDWGRKDFRKVSAAFGQAPKWKLMDDAALKRVPSWKATPFLYLFTHAFDKASPVCRGDDGQAVPLCLLPVSFQQKADLRGRQGSYFHYDHIWLSSGALEIAAYRQLADPQSALSRSGRELCRKIEKATGIPTYYYLKRYWARKVGEGARLCPGCGNKWRTDCPANESKPFQHFHFRCDKCRLVSREGDSTDGGRYTMIGEFATPRRGKHRIVQRKPQRPRTKGINRR